MRHHTDLLLEHLLPYPNVNVFVEVGKPNAEKGEVVDARYCITSGKGCHSVRFKDRERPRSRTFESFTCYIGSHISIDIVNYSYRVTARRQLERRELTIWHGSCGAFS